MADQRVTDFLRWYNTDLSVRVQADCRPRWGKHAEAEARLYLAQCDRWGVDPQLLALARQEAGQWAFRVHLRHLSKTSDKFLAQFADWMEGRAAEARRQEKIREATIRPDAGATRDGPSPLSETIRRAHQRDRDVCARLLVHGGYDPLSVWCPSCSERTACYDLRRKGEGDNAVH